MNPGIIAAIAYGILSLAGGAMGYAKARSKPSLISGSISGILLILGGILAAAGNVLGLKLAVVVASALVVVFIIRLVKTGKFMPAGLMIAGGVAAIAVMIPQVL